MTIMATPKCHVAMCASCAPKNFTLLRVVMLVGGKTDIKAAPPIPTSGCHGNHFS